MNGKNRILSYLPFFFYLLLNLYCVGIYFPTMNEATSLRGILLWYVLPLLGVILFGFLFLWGSRKWKSDNHKDRWIQLILFTVFNTLEGMLFSLVLLSLPNLTRMHILFSLFWLFALNSQYLAATSYQEGPVALSQKEKGTFIFSALFFFLFLLLVFSILVFNLNQLDGGNVPFDRLLPFDVSFLVASIAFYVIAILICFFSKKTKGIRRPFILTSLIVMDFSLLFTWMECLFSAGTQANDFNALASGTLFFLFLFPTIFSFAIARRQRKAIHKTEEDKR